MTHIITLIMALVWAATPSTLMANNTTSPISHPSQPTLPTVAPDTVWDKTFTLSDKVAHRKVTFTNGYGITLAADLYLPREASGPLAAIAVSGPFGACKEQASGYYAHQMAQRGFVTLAFDPSFTGESGGEPRATASPDINTDDFMSAVDFLTTLPEVDAERIGIIGICGWGGIALNTAAADTRIKATLVSTMYDMTRVAGNGYDDADDSEEARHKARVALAAQRTQAAREGHTTLAGGLPDKAPEGAPQFLVDYVAYYKTPRGYHPRSGNSNGGWHTFGTQAFANARFLYYINEIRSAVLMIHGEKAHSRYFGESAYHYMVEGKAQGYRTTVSPNPVPQNKELVIIPGATHCDLYDGGVNHNLIPWDKVASFFQQNLR